MESIVRFLNTPIISTNDIHVTIFHALTIMVILLATPFILKLVARFFNRLADNDKLDKDISKSIQLFVRYLAWTLVLVFIMQTIGFRLNYLLINNENIKISINHLIVITLVLIATSFILKIIGKIFSRMVDDGKIDQGSSTSIFLIIKYIVWILIIGLLLQTVGIKITLLIASSAALLVGIGLGIQQIFHDVASGIILLFERNLKVNDIIEVEDQVVGKVQEIGLRTSKVLTRDNIVMIIPNSKLISNNVINWSHHEALTRFKVEIGVAYGSDVNLVEKVLIKCASNHPQISTNRPPFVQFRNFGESSLDFHLFFWTNNTFQVEFIKSDLRFAINNEFKENGIQIPFPQRDVHIISQK